MNIETRLKKLEQTQTGNDSDVKLGTTARVEAELRKWAEFQFNCPHPREVFRLRQDFPPRGYQGREHLSGPYVTKGHCDRCGFDDYLWADYNLTEEQEQRRWQIKDEADSPREAYEAESAYIVELIEAGYVDLVPFPPPVEVQRQFTTKIRGEKSNEYIN